MLPLLRARESSPAATSTASAHASIHIRSAWSREAARTCRTSGVVRGCGAPPSDRPAHLCSVQCTGQRTPLPVHVSLTPVTLSVTLCVTLRGWALPLRPAAQASSASWRTTAGRVWRPRTSAAAAGVRRQPRRPCPPPSATSPAPATTPSSAEQATGSGRTMRPAWARRRPSQPLQRPMRATLRMVA